MIICSNTPRRQVEVHRTLEVEWVFSDLTILTSTRDVRRDLGMKLVPAEIDHQRSRFEDLLPFLFQLAGRGFPCILSLTRYSLAGSGYMQ